MYSQDRDSMRRHFFEAWRKSRDGAPLDPLERRITEVIREHPEYQALLEQPEVTLARDYPPESGETNPFLHMSLHLAVLEQVATDMPTGTRDLYLELAKSVGDTHRAAHRVMECLAKSLWQAQREGLPPDEQSYVACLKATIEVANGHREKH